MEFSDITFVVLTRDEASRIGDCLAALPAGSRALVYDAQSKDATAEIARRAGAQVVVAAWQGFGLAREAAAALVETPLTFMLDADESVPEELQAEIRDLSGESDVTAFSMPRRNYFCNRWIRGAGWWPDRLVRLFRTGHARIRARGGKAASALHEVWVPEGRCVELHNALEHHSYASYEEYQERFSRYTSIEARSAHAGPLAALAAWCMVPLRATWLALVRGGILDGWRGLYLSWWSAAYPAVVAAKAWHNARRAKVRHAGPEGPAPH